MRNHAVVSTKSGGCSGGRDGLRQWVLVAPLLLLIVVMFLVPIGRVLWFSVTEPTVGFQNYSLLLSSSGIRAVLWNTARICFLTTALSVGLGYIVAYMMAHATSRQARWMVFCVLVPFWVSVLVRAFAWLTLLQANGLINQVLIATGIIGEPLALVRNETGVVIGMVHYMLPYAILVLYAGMTGIDKRLVNAARGLGAGPMQAFLSVFLPLSLPAIFGATVLVLIFSLGFYVTPIILGGGKTIMIAEQISVQILQTANWGVGTMLASVLLLSVLLVFAIAGRVINVRSLFGA